MTYEEHCEAILDWCETNWFALISRPMVFRDNFDVDNVPYWRSYVVYPVPTDHHEHVWDSFPFFPTDWRV